MELKPSQRDNCACSRYGRKLLRKFTDEGCGYLQCACAFDSHSSRCQCTDLPWDTSLLSLYIGVPYLERVQQLDDPKNKQAYQLGRFLRCVVRDAANYTDPEIPANITLQSYEDKIFGRANRKSVDLRFDAKAMESFYRQRVGFIQGEFRKKYFRDLSHIDQTNVGVLEPKSPISSSEDIAVITELAPHLELFYEIRSMPNLSFRTTFQVVYLLKETGLAADPSDAYKLVKKANWPMVESDSNLRSRIDRGNKYLEGQLPGYKARPESAVLELLASRELIKLAADLILTNPDDRSLFIEKFWSKQ